MSPLSTTADLPQTSCNNSKLSFNAPEIELQRIQAEIARRSLHEFVRLAWPILEPATPFVDSMHVEAICLHLQAISENRLRHLIINVPPGHAKSLLAAVFWPVWDWIHNPARRWLFASYSADLSVRDRVRSGNNWKQCASASGASAL